MRTTKEPLPPESELAQLLQRCAARDSAAFRTLYDKTSAILFARLLRMLRRRSVAEEVLQDVYVRIWQRAAQFEVNRGKPLAWMVTHSGGIPPPPTSPARTT